MIVDFNRLISDFIFTSLSLICAQIGTTPKYRIFFENMEKLKENRGNFRITKLLSLVLFNYVILSFRWVYFQFLSTWVYFCTCLIFFYLLGSFSLFP